MSQIQQIKEASDIVALIGEKVSLTKSGTYYKGLCPFHNEKTPSFFVSEQMQRFQCFGCGAGGDVFEFLMRYDNMSFYEVLQSLAERVGISLRHEFKTQEDEQRESLLGCLELAKEYYHYLLTKHQVGEKAREYLKQRGVTSQSIKLFGLGYALPRWDGLIRYLHQKKKFSLSTLEQAGLITHKTGGNYYDRLRHRIIFPLRNHRGQVVGFSGRLLDPNAKEAKYINSPETVLYHKSKMLFGLSELRRQLVTAGAAVVTEGEFDVISSVQAEVNNVVAIKGSALTVDHAQLLKRVANTIILALDADAAGIEATKRALSVLKSFDLELKVVPMLEGKDPDDWARANPKEWRQAVKRPISAYQFLIDSSLNSHDLSSAQGKKQVIKELAPILWQIESAVEREFYLKNLATSLQTTFTLLSSDIRHFAEKSQSGKRGTPEQEETPVGAAQPVVPEQFERYLAFLLLRSKPSAVSERLQQLSEIELEWVVIKALVKAYLDNPNVGEISQLSKKLPDDLQQELMKVFVDKNFMLVLETGKEASEWQKTVEFVDQQLSARRRRALAAEIAQLESKPELSPTEQKKLNRLMAELAQNS